MVDKRKIELETYITVEDYRRVLFWFNKQIFFFIGIIFIFAILATGFIAFREGDVIALILFGLAIVFFVLYVLRTLLSIKRQSKNLAEVSEKTTIEFDEMGVKTNSESTLHQTTWERFAKIRESKTDFIFFPQNNIFYPIPKRFFKSGNQIEEFKQLITEKLGEKAKLKN